MSLQYFRQSNEQQLRLWLNRIWRPKGIIDKQDHSNASILYWNTANNNKKIIWTLLMGQLFLVEHLSIANLIGPMILSGSL